MKTEVETQLRDYWETVFEAHPELDADEVRLRPQQIDVPSPRRAPAWSPAWLMGFAALVVLVFIGGVAVLFGSQSSTEPADRGLQLSKPDANSEPLLDLPMSEVPPFRAEVRLTIDPLATAVASGGSVEDVEALITVSYGGPGLFRVDVTQDIPFLITSTEEPHDPYPDTPAAAVGSFIVVRDDEAAQYSAGESLFTLIEERDPLGLFAWESWNDLCTDGGHEFLEPEPVAGRDTLRLRCTKGSDAFELWVDAETGLLLRVAASEPLYIAMPGNYIPKVGYEVVSVEYEPRFAGGLFDLTAPQGATVEDASQGDELTGPEVGRAAPPLKGTSLDGAAFDLAELRGERVAILFWASWCDSPCLDALEDVASVAEVTEDVVFVTVLLQDRPDDARAMLLEHGIQIATIDPRGLSGEWGDGVPALVLVEQDGTVAVSHLGYRPVDTVEGVLRQAGW